MNYLITLVLIVPSNLIQIGERITLRLTNHQPQQLMFDCRPIFEQTCITIDYDQPDQIKQELKLVVYDQQYHINADFIQEYQQCQEAVQISCLTTTCNFVLQQSIRSSTFLTDATGSSIGLSFYYNTYNIIEMLSKNDLILTIKVNLLQLQCKFNLYANIGDIPPNYETYQLKSRSITHDNEVLYIKGNHRHILLFHSCLGMEISLQLTINSKQHLESGLFTSQIVHLEQEDIKFKIQNSLDEDILTLHIYIMEGSLVCEFDDSEQILLNQQEILYLVVNSNKMMKIISYGTSLFQVILDKNRIINIINTQIIQLIGQIETVQISNLNQFDSPSYFIHSQGNCLLTGCENIMSQEDDCEFGSNSIGQLGISFAEGEQQCQLIATQKVVINQAYTNIEYFIYQQLQSIFELKPNATIQTWSISGQQNLSLIDNQLIINNTKFGMYKIVISYNDNYVKFMQIRQFTNIIPSDVQYLVFSSQHTYHIELAITEGFIIEQFNDYNMTLPVQHQSTCIYPIYLKITHDPNYPFRSYQFYLLTKLSQSVLTQMQINQQIMVIYQGIKEKRLFMLFVNEQTLLSVHGFNSNYCFDFKNNYTIPSRRHLNNDNTTQYQSDFNTLSNNTHNSQLILYSAQFISFLIIGNPQEFYLTVQQKYINQQLIQQDDIIQLNQQLLYFVGINQESVLFYSNNLGVSYLVSYQNIHNKNGFYPNQEYYHEILNFNDQNVIRIQINQAICPLLLCVVRLRLEGNPSGQIVSYSDKYLWLTNYNINNHIISHLDSTFHIKSKSTTPLWCLISSLYGNIKQIINSLNNIGLPLINYLQIDNNDTIIVLCLEQCKLLIQCTTNHTIYLQHYPIFININYNISLTILSTGLLSTQIYYGNPLIIRSFNRIDIIFKEETKVLLFMEFDQSANNQITLNNNQILPIYGSGQLNISNIYISSSSAQCIQLCVKYGIVKIMQNDEYYEVSSINKLSCENIIFTNQSYIQVQYSAYYLQINYLEPKNIPILLNYLNIIQMNEQLPIISFKQTAINISITINCNFDFAIYDGSSNLLESTNQSNQLSFSKQFNLISSTEISIVIYNAHSSIALLSISYDNSPIILLNNFTITSFQSQTDWIIEPIENYFYIVQMESLAEFTYTCQNRTVSSTFVQEVLDTPESIHTSGTMNINSNLFILPCEYRQCFEQSLTIEIPDGNVMIPNVTNNDNCQLVALQLMIGDQLYHVNSGDQIQIDLINNLKLQLLSNVLLSSIVSHQLDGYIVNTKYQQTYIQSDEVSIIESDANSNLVYYILFTLLVIFICFGYYVQRHRHIEVVATKTSQQIELVNDITNP